MNTKTSTENYNVVDDYGLLLGDDAIKYIASQTSEDFSEERFDIKHISEFTGDAIKINDKGMDGWGLEDACESFSGGVIHFIPLDHYPSLSCADIVYAEYENVNEIIDELKQKVGSYLPEDFDYRSNIRHISGIYKNIV